MLVLIHVPGEESPAANLQHSLENDRVCGHGGGYVKPACRDHLQGLLGVKGKSLLSMASAPADVYLVPS